MQSHHKAAASVIAEALEAAKRSVASKSGKLKDSENRPSETNLVSANGRTVPCLIVHVLASRNQAAHAHKLRRLTSTVSCFRSWMCCNDHWSPKDLSNSTGQWHVQLAHHEACNWREK